MSNAYYYSTGTVIPVLAVLDFDRIPYSGTLPSIQEGVIDEVHSLTWSSSFYEAGYFSMTTRLNEKNRAMIAPGKILRRMESVPRETNAMMIDNVTYSVDENEDGTITATGRSLECVLDLRVVQQTVVYGWANASVPPPNNQPLYFPYYQLSMRLFNTYIGDFSSFFTLNFTSPLQIANRTNSSNWSGVTTTRGVVQRTGNSLYDNFVELLSAESMGWMVQCSALGAMVVSNVPIDNYANSQSLNTPIVFNAETQMVLSTEYQNDRTNWYNVMVVAGEGEGTNRQVYVYNPGNVSGTARREKYIDARDIQISDDISAADYVSALRDRAKEKSSEYLLAESFTVTINDSDSANYRLRTDYQMGYKITIQDTVLGIEGDYVITGITETFDAPPNGYTLELTLGIPPDTTGAQLRKIRRNLNK